jgi:hypothetical protein
MLLLILHLLQIVQILDAVLDLVKSMNVVVMIVCQHLLRCLLLHFLYHGIAVTFTSIYDLQ